MRRKKYLKNTFFSLGVNVFGIRHLLTNPYTVSFESHCHFPRRISNYKPFFSGLESTINRYSFNKNRLLKNNLFCEKKIRAFFGRSAHQKSKTIFRVYGSSIGLEIFSHMTQIGSTIVDSFVNQDWFNLQNGNTRLFFGTNKRGWDSNQDERIHTNS